MPRGKTAREMAYGAKIKNLAIELRGRLGKLGSALDSNQGHPPEWEVSTRPRHRHSSLALWMSNGGRSECVVASDLETRVGDTY